MTAFEVSCALRRSLHCSQFFCAHWAFVRTASIMNAAKNQTDVNKSLNVRVSRVLGDLKRLRNGTEHKAF
jgi:hypothetical protein